MTRVALPLHRTRLPRSAALVFFIGANAFSALLAVPDVSGQEQLTEHTLRSEPEQKVILDLADAEWLVGTWHGEGFGGPGRRSVGSPLPTVR